MKNDTNDSIFKLFSIILISILDRGRNDEIEKLFSLLPNMTNEIFQVSFYSLYIIKDFELTRT
jgi:hypothetical protein